MKKNIQITKVPLEKPATTNEKSSADFPRMPRMYLELMENKDKVKQSVVNKEYDPDEAATLFSWKGDEPKKPSEDVASNKISEVSEEEDVEEESEGSQQGESQSAESGEESGSDVESVGSEATTTSVAHSPRSSNSSATGSVISQAAEPTRKKIMEMLEAPPKLSDLEKKGEIKTQKVIPNLNRMNIGTEEEDELKRELLFKFELIKKKYKNIDIPEFTMHSDFKNMNRTYENTVRRVSLDSSVESYKSLLIGGFMLIEFVLGVWLKLDMAGFTQQQIINMNQYERLLIELGEKSYVPGGSQWPVEVRLIGLILLNSVIFIVSKIIVKKTGSSVINMMNAFNNGMNQVPARPKRKMKGPSVSIDDLPEEEEGENE